MGLEDRDGGESRWQFGNVVLDERSWQLFIGTEEVPLERKAFELLRYLIVHAGQALSRDAILEAVWPKRVVGENSLTKCIGRLRKVIGDPDGEVIRTLHGRGYRLDAEVSQVALAGPQLAPPCRVLFVEDHDLFRAGIKVLLTDFPQRLHFEEARTAAQGLGFARIQRFDLVILDLGLPGEPTGLAAVAAFREALPFASIVVVSGEEHADTVRSAVALGAVGYIPKSSSHAVMSSALAVVLAGGTYVPSYAAVDPP